MLTFDKIRELERAEANSKSLQKMPDNFFSELSDYLSRKKASSHDKELENIRNTIRNLFNIRERKMLDMVVYTVRTGNPPENLLPEEEKLFTTLVSELGDYRNTFFGNLDKQKTLFKVLKDIPEFVGPDLKKYNLKKDDIVVLPKALNDLLLKKSVIKKLNNNACK